ncbi:hypothetical protein AZH51_16325 [Branchiibius sp. NY16-3462-2]|nr:hypothetical protein AZH51_16325 [Branchiibius sp. NY16-3462-2]
MWVSEMGGPAVPVAGEVPAEGPATGKRGKVVAVRLYPAEWEAWVAAAADEGRAEVGRWVRERITESLNGSDERGPGRAEAVAELMRTRAELARIGNNVNQAMRYAHSTAGGPGQVAAVVELTAAVEAAAAAMSGLRQELAERL